MQLHAGLNEAAHGYVGVQPVDAGAGIGRVEMVLEQDLPGAPARTKAYGSLVKETYSRQNDLLSREHLDSASRPDVDVLAWYGDGRAAITKHDFGQGKAILIGSYLGLSYHRQKDPSTGAVIAGLVECAADLERPIVRGRGRVRVDTLSGAGGHMVIVQNLERMPSEVSVELRGLELTEIRELFTGEVLRVTPGNGTTTIVVSLAPKEVRVYRA
jgi:hypothetical protein